MKNKQKPEKEFKGISAFSLLYFVGLILVIEQLIDYSQWTSRLLRKWELPDAPFFSKITLVASEAQLSLSLYATFAIAYIFFYVFILIGFVQLNKAIQLLSKKQIFLPEISSAFKKAGRSLLIFVIGTFVVDVVLLMVASTSRPVKDLFATETIVFVILAYLLFFLSDILKAGVLIKEENELTI